MATHTLALPKTLAMTVRMIAKNSATGHPVDDAEHDQ